MYRLALVIVIASATAACFGEDKKDDGDPASCAARVRDEYPVPPGNINTQNQMIREECGG